jgi:hypothetical protein
VSTAPKMKPVKAAGKPSPSPALATAVTGDTAREQAPQKLSENDRIRKALEGAGFKMTSEPISLGGKLFVPIQPPVQPSAARSANPNLRIRRSLEAAGFKMTGDPISLGGKLFAGLHPRSLNKDAPVVTPSLSPPVALPAAVKRDGKSLEAAGFQRPESIQVGGNQFVVLRPNRIVFVPVHGGWTAAQKGFSRIQLLNTY